MNTKRFRAAVILVAIMSTCLPASAFGQTTDEQRSVSLAPSRFRGTATSNTTYGPITLGNSTKLNYGAHVFPVLLDQIADGGFVVKDDPASRAEASRLLEAQFRAFPLPTAGHRSVIVRTKHVARDEGVYAGMLFQASPDANQGTQVQQVLRLNATFLLDPIEPRIDLTAGSFLPEQANDQIQLRLPMDNTGNVYTPMAGEVIVRDPSGRVVNRVPLGHQNILPKATVDLTGLTTGTLPAGQYTLKATIRSRNKRFTASGSMRLFGPNQIATEQAKILRFDQPRAFLGESTSISARFVNKGNVKFAPEAVLLIRPLGARTDSKPVATAKLSADSVSPGAQGDVSGSVDLPTTARAYQLTLELRSKGRVLDSASVGVAVGPKRSATSKLGVWLWIILALLLIGIAAGVWYWRRTRAESSAPGDVAASAVEPASDAGPALININKASTAELRSLPGVGPKAAERIVEHREEYGDFDSLEALSAVEGFGEARIQGLAGRAEV